MTAIRLKVLTILVCAFAIAASGCSSESTPAAAASPQPAAAQSSSQAATAPAGQSQAPASSATDATEDARSPAEVDAEQFGLPPGIIGAKWTGDLDGMLQRRVIRVLTTYSKTNYFVDRGTQRGAVYDGFQLFEADLNKKLENKNIRVHVVFIPVA